MSEEAMEVVQIAHQIANDDATDLFVNAWLAWAQVNQNGGDKATCTKAGAAVIAAAMAADKAEIATERAAHEATKAELQALRDAVRGIMPVLDGFPMSGLDASAHVEHLRSLLPAPEADPLVAVVKRKFPSRWNWPASATEHDVNAKIDSICGCAGKYDCNCVSVFNRACSEMWFDHNSPATA